MTPNHVNFLYSILVIFILLRFQYFTTTGIRVLGLRKRVGAMVGDEGKVKIDRFDGKDFGF